MAELENTKKKKSTSAASKQIRVTGGDVDNRLQIYQDVMTNLDCNTN